MQLGPIRRMPASASRRSTSVSRSARSDAARFAESGGEEVNDPDAFGNGVVDQVENCGGGDCRDQ